LLINFSNKQAKNEKYRTFAKKIMKPLVKYRGGKSNEISNIEKHIPRYRGRYIEPFFGGGALYFHLEPKRAIINDINSNI